MRRSSSTSSTCGASSAGRAGGRAAAIIALVVQTRHHLHAPFCGRCSFKRTLAPVVSLGSLVLAVIAFFGGIIIGIGAKSWLVGIVGVLAAVGIAVFAGWYDRSANPKYVKVDAKNVIINDPTLGHVVLVAPPPTPY